MNTSRIAFAALLSLAVGGLAVAQTPPSEDTTSPSSASSPAQRDSTSTPASEAAPSNGADPSAASSPHQQQATDGSMAGMDKSKHDKMMKDCIAQTRAKDSSMSKSDAKKACNDQMKMSSSDQTSSSPKP